MESPNLMLEEGSHPTPQYSHSLDENTPGQGFTISCEVIDLEEVSDPEGSGTTLYPITDDPDKASNKAKDHGNLARDKEGKLYWLQSGDSGVTGWRPATYLTTEVRRDMLDEMAKQGVYKHDRPVGPGNEDITCFHPDQADWGEVRVDRPDILFQYNKPKAGQSLDPVDLFVYKGDIIIDKESEKPLRGFPNLPMCLSSVEDGWLLEAFCRQDQRITHDDLRDRMPHELRPDIKTISMRRSRFRWRTGCKSWVSRSASDSLNQYLDSVVPQVYQSINSTRGWRDLTDGEVTAMKDINLGKFPERSRKKDKAVKGKKDSNSNGSLHGVRGGRVSSKKTAPQRASHFLDPDGGATHSSLYFNLPVASNVAEQTQPKAMHHESGFDFRDKVPSSNAEKRAIQRALAPTRLKITELSGLLTPPTDECTSYREQFEALHHHCIEWLARVNSSTQPQALDMYEDGTGWIEGFPDQIFWDDMEMPETLGDRI